MKTKYIISTLPYTYRLNITVTNMFKKVKDFVTHEW